MTSTPYNYTADLQERAATTAEHSRDWREFGDETMATAHQVSAARMYAEIRERGER